MNCRTCGALLPAGGENCPRCGTLLSATTEVGPDDPTVGSLWEERRAQPLPHAPGISPYQNPYESYVAAPQTPTRRTGGRVALIAGALLLVALLIGGGVLAWLASSSASIAANTAAATRTARDQAAAAAAASATAVPQTFVAQGSATVLKSTPPLVRQEGSRTISSFTQQGVIEGGIAGSYTNEETSTLASDNSGTFSGQVTCICTVAGKSGILTWSYTGTQAADGSFQGQFFAIHGTGNLATLHGQGNFQGQGPHLTYSSRLQFAS